MMSLRNLWRFKCQISFICNRLNKIRFNYQSIYLFNTIVDNNVGVITVRDSVDYWSRRFVDEGIPEPVESIQHIISHVMGIEKCLELIHLQDNKLSEEQSKKLETLCLCRLSRMPVQYIIGEWTFRDINIKLIPPIFIPRAETEMLVDFVAKQIFNNNRGSDLSVKILEIGCGSGAISLAILHLCQNKMNIKCISIDQNIYACQLAKDNAKKLGISDNNISIINATIQDNGEILVASGESEINFSNEQFDIIVSNPPYIPTPKINDLPSEIKIFEDIRALDGGVDGLKIIKSIIKYASTGLKPTGHLFLEVDPTHPKTIQYLISKFTNMKLKYKHTYKDYCNRDRFVEICKIE